MIPNKCSTIVLRSVYGFNKGARLKPALVSASSLAHSVSWKLCVYDTYTL